MSNQTSNTSDTKAKTKLTRATRLTGAIAAVLAATVAFFAWAQVSQAEDSTAQKLRQGLESFGNTANALASNPLLQDAMALTGADPAEALRLTTLFQEAMTEIPNDASSVTNFIEKLNDPSLDKSYGGVDVAIGCKTGETAPGDCQDVSTSTTGNIVRVNIPIRASRTIANAPFALDADTVDINGGALNATFNLATTLRVELDTTNPNELLAFSVVDSVEEPAAMTLSASLSTPNSPSFSTSLGFTNVTVTPTITSATASLPITLHDPDSSGRITRDEFVSTAINDLATVEKSGAVDASIAIDTPLTAGVNPDATVNLADTDLSNGYGPITVATPTLGRLTDFRSITPEQAVAGLAELAGGLTGIKNSGNPSLPFLQDGVAKVFDAAQPLLDLVDRYSVVCGTKDGPQPTGDVSNLAPGTQVFCRAKTSVDPTGATTWTIANGTPATVTDDAATPNAVGTNPGRTVSFTMTQGGAPNVSASFPTAVGTKSITRPPSTAQVLMEQLRAVAGFEDIPNIDELAYDAATRALTFRLRRTWADSATAPIAGQTATTFDFGDRLKSVAKLGGLNQASGATVSVNPGQVVLDLTFGMILVPDFLDITPADNAVTTDINYPPGQTDRFFVKVNPAEPELKFADAAITANVALEGQIGYLKVAAVGASDAPNPANDDPIGHAFRIGKADPNADLLTVNVSAPGVPVNVDGSTQTIADAIRIRELLARLSERVSANLNARLDAGLNVTATLGDSATPIASGKVGITWPNVLVGTPQVEADGGFNQDLLSFDAIDPANPQALLSLLLNGLDTLSNAIDGSSNSVFETRIPVVGVTPKQVLSQFRRVKTATDELRGANPGDVVCGTHDRDADHARPWLDPNQSLDALVFTGNTPIRVFCQATNPKAATAATWTLGGGGATAVLNGSGAGAIPTVGQNPTSSFSFDVTRSMKSDTTPTGWTIDLAYTDEDGEHDLDVPDSSAPRSLQDLENAIEDKLGIPEGALTLEIKPFGTPAVRHLVVRLNFSQCTSADPAQTGVFDDNAGIADCAAGDKRVPKLSAPLALDLGTEGGLVGVGANPNVSLEYIGRALLNFAVPLTASPTPTILDSSGVHLEAGVSSDDLNLTANVGPIEINLGTAVDTTAGAPHNAGAGVLRLKANFDLANGASATPKPANEEQPIASFDNINAAFTSGGGVTGCGELQDDDDASPDPVSLDGGPGCAKLALGLGNTYLGDLGVKVESLPSGFRIITPQNLEDRIQDALLDWDMLVQSIPKLLQKLEAALDGTQSGVKVPLIGDALDAGADVVNKIRTTIEPPLNGLSAAMASGSADGDSDTDAADLRTRIQDGLFASLGPSGANLLQDNFPATPGQVSKEDVGVKCNSLDCLDGTSLGTLNDVRLTFPIGQGTVPNTPGCSVDCEAGTPIPFDIGLDGLPVRLTGTLVPQVGWRALIDFGLSRNEGPYIVTGGAGHGLDPNAPELVVGAGVSLGNAATPCPAQGVGTTVGLVGYSTQRCIQGTLGFLGVTAYDGNVPTAVSTDDDPTQISLLASLNLTGPQRIRLIDIPSQLGATPAIRGSANVDALIRTGVKADETASLPAILGTLHISWNWGSSAPGGASVSPTSTAPTINFKNLHLDAGEFISKFLDPIVKEVKNITSPLKPVIDTLQAEVPVVSELAQLVGGDPVTLIDLMAKVSGSNLDVVKSVIAFLDFANRLPTSGGLVPLGAGGPGAFNVDGNAAKGSPLTPDKAGSLVVPVAGGERANVMEGISTEATSRPAPAVQEPRDTTFGVPGLSFPLFTNAGKIFGVLMGKDEAIVKYDLGRMQATAGFSYSFGPFMIGPVPVTANIGGSATIAGQFSFGYDTSGLRKVLEGGSGEHLFDGIFIDDLRNNIDVPEVSLIGEVYAGASVNIAVVEAGVEGGITLTVDLNLNDSPQPDGVLRIEEIFNKLNNPICLFDVSGRLEAFLRFFFEVDLFFVSERFEFDILRITLLDFSASCAPPQPVLATRAPTGVLTLNMGSESLRTARQIQQSVIDEKFVIRQLGPGKVSVAAFGAYQEFSNVASVFANAGDGEDSISFLPGATNNVTASNGTQSAPQGQQFTIPVTVLGGIGPDAITTGDGNDTVYGDDNDGDETNDANDIVVAGGGDDRVFGEGGDDQIDGGFGDDSRGLYGGGGGDSIKGGPGGDHIDGGIGNDALAGGPGQAPPASGTPPAEADLGDVIIGNAGNDTLTGNFGNDSLHGGYRLFNFVFFGGLDGMCSSTSGPTGEDRDQLDGGPGNDEMTGGPDTDAIVGGENNDTACGNGGNDVMEGDSPNPGNDFLDGGPDNDVITGNAGDDIVRGAEGNDKVDGGDGHDDVFGGTGRDLLIGGNDQDIVLGDTGTIDGHTSFSEHSSALHTGPRAAVLTAVHVGNTTGTDAPWDCNAYSQTNTTAGNSDCVTGGAGADYLFGEGGNDSVLGDDGEDYLEGNNDADYMRGGSLRDTMHGNAGEDEMHGDSGNDQMYGDADCDVMRGGIGDDDMEGNGGSDRMNGDADQDNIVGGSSVAGAEDDESNCGDIVTAVGDFLYGNAEADVIAGDNAVIAWTNAPDADDASAKGRTVTLLDVNSADATLAGPDTIEGNEHNDRLYGQGENDTMHGGIGIDRMEGNDDNDTMNGDDGNDLMLGGSSASPATDEDGDDTMNGNNNDDVIVGDNGVIAWDGMVTPPTGELEGTFGVDTIHGNADYDRIYGELGGDHLFGDAGPDYLLGDRGTITPSSTPQAVWPGGAPNNVVVLYAPETGGEDDIHGNGADDHMYGGWANDTMEGGPADDYMEGNGGRDRMFGLAEAPTPSELLEAGPLNDGDEDDMLGGSSSGVSPDPRSDDGELDMLGNLEQDVMTGDNADITRIINPADNTKWAIDNITGGAARTVVLLDREKTGAALDAVSGGDLMKGNEGNDRMYGEGGPDGMRGNSEDDYLEGNQDDDAVEGNGGEDDLIGGSSFEAGAVGSGVGDPDAADLLYGGAGADVVTGDNAVITRDPAVPGGPYDWTTVKWNWLPPVAERYIVFLDKGPLDADRFGGDTISGGAESDVLFGQDGVDRIFGGSHDDYMEGNGGADVAYGDQVPAASSDSRLSTDDDLNGIAGPDGQDDQIGGSSLVVATAEDGALSGHRDEADELHGDGAADFQLGDNGRIMRRVVNGQWKTYFAETARHTVVRQASFQSDPETRLPARYDVGAGVGSVAGGDTLYGDAGDDYQFGQDGDDVIYGGTNDDDQYGELGDDRVFGEEGEDAQVGDRGLIVNRREDGSREIRFDTKGPGFFKYRGLLAGQYDRRVTLTDDGDGAPQQALGLVVGGRDRLRGGPHHDSMHGAFGDDLMNGDSGGDWLFGDDGADVMWGGKGSDDPLNRNDRGVNDSLVDYLFGGHGGPREADPSETEQVLAADILDFLPRNPAPGFEGDPVEWFEMTNTVKGAVDPNPGDDQYHQGIDWIYGGWGRDVLEGDVGKNGPDFGDRLIDWNGAFNMYARCNASYGDDGDIRMHSPSMQKLLHLMAYGSGAGMTQAEVTQSGTSAYRELALVYPNDPNNAAVAFPTTPGHFEIIQCTPGGTPTL